jgi:hypothetical protein
LFVNQSWGRCSDQNFLQLQPIFGGKNGVFLKNQCYDKLFVNTSNSFSKKAIFSPIFWRKYLCKIIFAQWEIIYFRQFYKYYRSGLKFWLTFFPSIDYVLILIKKWLGYVLGDFFTNSSG